jgi:hypothetical protein
MTLARRFNAGCATVAERGVAAATVELSSRRSTVAAATPRYVVTRFPALKRRAKVSLPLTQIGAQAGLTLARKFRPRRAPSI